MNTKLETLTVPQLRQLAREAGLRGRSQMRKAELIAALTEVAEEVAAETDESLPLVSPVRAAINALETYLEVVGRLGAENGGPEVGAAWEDYLDASFAAETCTLTICWDRATDDGRCGKHSWGAPLGQDVVPSEGVSRETADEEFASVPAEVVAEPDPTDLADLPLTVLRRLDTRCQTPARFGLSREELVAHLAEHTTREQRYEAAREIATSVTRAEAEALALADVRRGYTEAEVPADQVVAHVQANCEIWRVESDDAGDPIVQFAYLVVLGARVPADENPEVRCAQCGSTHGNTEPNAIECDCWPNGVLTTK